MDAMVVQQSVQRAPCQALQTPETGSRALLCGAVQGQARNERETTIHTVWHTFCLVDAERLPTCTLYRRASIVVYLRTRIVRGLVNDTVGEQAVACTVPVRTVPLQWVYVPAEPRQATCKH